MQNTPLLDILLSAWFIIAALSVGYVAWDAFRNNPELVVMKWGWVLVTAFTGTVGLAFYILSCKEPAPYTHEEFIRPLWKQAMGSTVHCVAGDAIAIVAAAAVTAALPFPMWVDVVIEYVFGFAFGLLIFQSLFMRDMMGGSYLRAVRMSLIPEWLSMNLVMAGMVAIMVPFMSHDPAGQNAASLHFWGIMSLAVLVGSVAAYPVNAWLVAKGLKHGMGTVREDACSDLQPVARREAAAIAMGYMSASLPVSPRAHRGEHSADASVSPAGGTSDGAMVHGEVQSDVTRPQLTAVAFLTLDGLAAGVLIAGILGRFSM